MIVRLFSKALKESADSIREDNWDQKQRHEGWPEMVLSGTPPFQVDTYYDNDSGLFVVVPVTATGIRKRIAELHDELADLQAALALASNPSLPNEDDLRVVRNYHSQLKQAELRSSALKKLSDAEKASIGLKDEGVEA